MARWDAAYRVAIVGRAIPTGFVGDCTVASAGLNPGFHRRSGEDLRIADTNVVNEREEPRGDVVAAVRALLDDGRRSDLLTHR